MDETSALNNDNNDNTTTTTVAIRPAFGELLRPLECVSSRLAGRNRERCLRVFENRVRRDGLETASAALQALVADTLLDADRNPIGLFCWRITDEPSWLERYPRPTRDGAASESDGRTASQRALCDELKRLRIGVAPPEMRAAWRQDLTFVRQLEAAGATPTEIARRAKAYRQHPSLGGSGCALTLRALCKWWAQLEYDAMTPEERLTHRMSEYERREREAGREFVGDSLSAEERAELDALSPTDRADRLRQLWAEQQREAN